MLLAVLQVLYFFVPAYLANMAPVLVRRRLARLAIPIDGGRSWRGTRIFGDHKTWRGVLVGTATGGVAFLVQRELHAAGVLRILAPTDLGALPAWTGLLLGFGALAGDAVKSFFKRRVGIRPGASWVGPDQLDFYLGAWACAALVWAPPPGPMLLSLPVVFVGDVVTNVAGWAVGLKDSWV